METEWGMMPTDALPGFGIVDMPAVETVNHIVPDFLEKPYRFRLDPVRIPFAGARGLFLEIP